MKRVLILGISGFTGYYFDHFADRARLSSRFELIGADVRKPRLELLSCSSFYEIDATDRGAIEKLILFTRPSYIANLVGVFRATSYSEFIRLNVDVSRHIFDVISSIDKEVEKLLLIGSAAEYGDVLTNPVSENAETRPISPYGLSKLIQTATALYYHRSSNIPCVIARTFNIIGNEISTHLSVGNFLAQIRDAKDGDTILVGNTDTQRDFLAIEEVVSYYWDLLIYGEPGEIYNVCSGIPTRIGDILQRMICESGKDLKIERSERLVRTRDIPCIYGDRSKLNTLRRAVTACGS